MSSEASTSVTYRSASPTPEVRAWRLIPAAAQTPANPPPMIRMFDIQVLLSDGPTPVGRALD